jgi:hypothetical protein
MRACSACLLLISAAACEPVVSPSTFPAQIQDVVSSDVAAGEVAASPGGVMTGVWALATDWSSCAELGDRAEVRARSLTRVAMTQKSNRLIEQREICRIESTPALGMTTVVPPAALAAVNPLLVESLALDDGAGGQAYASGVEVQLWGLQLQDPLGDAMPVSAQDPRIVDADLDGHPGVTYELGGICSMYISQRSLAVVTAVRGKDGAFTGGAVRTNEQLIVGATQGICQAPHVVHSNDKHNHVRLVRVDAQGLALDDDGNGTVTCAEIIANQAKIITWVEADDTRCN